MINLRCNTQIVRENALRVAQLGDWADCGDPVNAMLSRVPTDNYTHAAGFDAGIACCLDIIPRDNQKLSATLHANYTPAAVEQIQREIFARDFVNTDTCWWLFCCSFCSEEQTAYEYMETSLKCAEIAKDSDMRLELARNELFKMNNRFVLQKDGIALVTGNGGAQGAYIAGHTIAIEPMHGIWFVSTYEESLGLPEDFEWEDPPTEENPLSDSGPVWGSKNYVKAANFKELARVLECVKVVEST